MTDAERQQEIERLYRQAFAEFGAAALWSSRQVARPLVPDAVHTGARRGHWPSSPEIGSAMLRQYDAPPG